MAEKKGLGCAVCAKVALRRQGPCSLPMRLAPSCILMQQCLKDSWSQVGISGLGKHFVGKEIRVWERPG